MHVLKVNPIKAYSFVRNCNHINKDSILIGKCHDNLYFLSNLIFQPILINSNEVLLKATLKMF